MEYYIGLDIGTSSVKGALVTAEGRVVHTAKEVFHYCTTDDGRRELDAGEYLNACFGVLRILSAEAEGGVLKGICASSASGNLLLLDRENRPVTGIISWQDGRVKEEAEELLCDIDRDAFYRCTGWTYDFKSFPLSQLCYLKKHSPRLLEECGMVCMSTEYLNYVLTGKWGISPSAGTPSYLLDQVKGEYISPLLERMGLCKEKLPPVMACGTVLGTVREEMESVCGVPAGTPVVLGSFDHPSAARGVGVCREGEMLLSCGTSWVAFFPLSDREKGIRAGMLMDPYLSPEGCFGAMTSIASLSGRLQLYVNRYIDDSKDAFSVLSALAAESVKGANGLRINPMEEPEDAKLCAYEKKHIARAIMEGTVELLKKRLDELAEKGIRAGSAVMVGGPSEDPYWIWLIQEMCGISVRVEHGSFAGAVGAAVIAGAYC